MNSDAGQPGDRRALFGAAPALVARHVAAAVAGTQAAGVAACAKHFPGHGDTTVDSHVGLPTVGAPTSTGALAPFRAAVGAGVATVMTGHLLVPGYGAGRRRSTRRWSPGCCGTSWASTALVVSDALEMGAIAGSVGRRRGSGARAAGRGGRACLGGTRPASRSPTRPATRWSRGPAVERAARRTADWPRRPVGRGPAGRPGRPGGTAGRAAGGSGGRDRGPGGTARAG